MASPPAGIRCAPPLLLIVVDGVDGGALGAAAAAAQLPVAARVPLRLPPQTAAAAAVAAVPAAAPLRELGLSVDRRSLCVWPAWRGDEAQLQLLAARTSGPAAVTFLQLRQPLQQAALHGPASAAAAAARARLPERLAAAAAAVCFGELPEVWLLAGGDATPVQRTFDVAKALRRRSGVFRPRLRLEPERLLLAPRSERQRQQLAAMLAAPPFAQYGRLLPAERAEQLCFAAADRVAFGARPWRGRRALQPQAEALLPQAKHTASPLDVGGLLGRLLLRALALAETLLPAAVPLAPIAAAPAPDLAAALAAPPP